jgi:AraC family transcriptional regulator
MSSTVVKKHLEQTPILFMRRRVEHDQIAQALGELLPAVYGHAMKHGIPMAGPPFCRYENWTQGGVTLEAGLPIAAAAEGEGDIVAGTLAGGPVATTIHIGPYDGLPKAHAALERWFADNGLEPAGAPWESYLTDPGEVPDPAQWQTAIIRPIRS